MILKSINFGCDLETLRNKARPPHVSGKAGNVYKVHYGINPRESTLFTRSLLYSLNHEIANPNLVSDFDLDIGKVVPLAEIMLPSLVFLFP